MTTEQSSEASGSSATAGAPTSTSPASPTGEGLAEVLKNDYGVRRVLLTTKFTSTKPAGEELIQHMAAEADFLVAGVAL